MVPTRELATQVKEELDPLLNGKSLTAVAIYGGANIESKSKLSSEALTSLLQLRAHD